MSAEPRHPRTADGADTAGSTDTDGSSVDRRSLLRTGGAAVAAGIAGLGIAQTVRAAPSGAAAGDPIVAGSTNTAGTAVTTLTSAAAGAPTFAVANTTDSAPLRLAQQALPANDSGFGSGDLSNLAGHLFYTAGGSSGPVTTLVYTEFAASQLVPIAPQRMVDTRSAAGRTHIVNASGNLDSTGRLIGGKTIVVDLSTLVVAATGAFCNMTAVNPVGPGYLLLWPGGTRPATSSLNYVKNAVVANFAVTGTSATDTVSVYSPTTTHVLLDVTAFAVGSVQQVNPGVVAAAAPAQTLQQRRAADTLPRWYHGG